MPREINDLRPVFCGRCSEMELAWRISVISGFGVFAGAG